MRQILTKNHNGLLRYEIAPEITAFSPLRDAVLPIRVVQAHQVHGDRVAVVTSAGTTREELEGYDALVTDVPGVAIGARTADCIPVLMYDPVHKAVAAVHSGWKGTVVKIAAKTLAVRHPCGNRSRHRSGQLPGRSGSRRSLPRRRIS